MAENPRRLLGLPFVLLFTGSMVSWELWQAETPNYAVIAGKAGFCAVVMWAVFKFFDRFAGRTED